MSLRKSQRRNRMLKMSWLGSRSFTAGHTGLWGQDRCRCLLRLRDFHILLFLGKDPNNLPALSRNTKDSSHQLLDSGVNRLLLDNGSNLLFLLMDHSINHFLLVDNAANLSNPLNHSTKSLTEVHLLNPST